MAAEISSIDANNAALIGAIEIMISPEYGMDWVKELASLVMGDENTTEEATNAIDDLITEKLMPLARILFDQLDEPYRTTYADRFPNLP